MASALTPDQVKDYVVYIHLPERYHPDSKPALNKELLAAIHVHQLAKIPYENLVLHYSNHKAVSLDPDVLFKKIVFDSRGRGGYCMENATILNHLLRAFGFDVYIAGGRVRPRILGVPSGSYLGWVHAVNIVSLPDGTKWMLDVGFGGDGPTKPMPLVSGQVTQNLGLQDVRLIYDSIDDQTDKSQRLWIYQYRNGPDKEWNSSYCFVTTEFLPQDLQVMNYFTSTNTEAWNIQTQNLLAVKYMKEGDLITGKMMLRDKEIKRNNGGKTEVVKVCSTEEERIEALWLYFDISLTQEEKMGMKGSKLELQST